MSGLPVTWIMRDKLFGVTQYNVWASFTFQNKSPSTLVDKENTNLL